MSQHAVSLAETWKKFALIHFGSKHLSTEIRSWAEQNPFAYLESCARQVWAGLESGFTDFPIQTAQQEMTLLKGAAAYQYTLELMLGLKSEKIGEDHIVRQMREKWERFSEEHPELELELRPVFETLERDNHIIRSKIINYMLPERYEKAVQIASGQQKGDSVLIAGHITRSGEPSDDFRNLGLFLCNNRNGRPLVNEVAICAPTKTETSHLIRWFLSHQDQKRVHPNISFVPVSYEDANIAVEVFNRIYMTSTMGKSPELETSFNVAWRNRSRKDNTLSLLRGDPELRGQSSDKWLEIADSTVILPENIWELIKKVKSHNQELAKNAQLYAGHCAQARVSGTPPSHQFVTENIGDISIKLS